MEQTEQELRITQLLDSFVPDLATDSKYCRFIHNLFQCEKGVWASVRDLCRGLTEIDGKFEALAALAESELVVIWLNYPFSDDYAYIHFYLDDCFWMTSAIYNLKFIPTTALA